MTITKCNIKYNLINQLPKNIKTIDIKLTNCPDNVLNMTKEELKTHICDITNIEIPNIEACM